jgi:hypothetical protein
MAHARVLFLRADPVHQALVALRDEPLGERRRDGHDVGARHPRPDHVLRAGDPRVRGRVRGSLRRGRLAHRERPRKRRRSTPRSRPRRCRRRPDRLRGRAGRSPRPATGSCSVPSRRCSSRGTRRRPRSGPSPSRRGARARTRPARGARVYTRPVPRVKANAPARRPAVTSGTARGPVQQARAMCRYLRGR